MISKAQKESETQSLMDAIGVNITYYREERGLSQTDLAKEAGVDRVHVCRLENGHCMPKADMLFAICDALHISADAVRQIRKRVNRN